MTESYICYCFKHTREAIEANARTHGKSTIMEDIIAHSKAGHCNCKINNPKNR